MGLHLGSLDLLIENESNKELIEPDVPECLKFMKELHDIADEFTQKDGMGRFVEYEWWAIFIMIFMPEG